MRKWVSNGPAKPVLFQVPQSNHVPSVGRIEIGSQPLSDSLALGLTWDLKSNALRVSNREFVEKTTTREKPCQVAGEFNLLGIVSQLLLSGKLVLQKVAASGID